MDPINFLFSSSSDSEDDQNVALIRKNIRDKSNPLSLPEVEFKRRFRLSQEAFKYVLGEIRFSGHMSKSVPGILQLAAKLNLLASGSFQHNVGNDFLLGVCLFSIVDYQSCTTSSKYISITITVIHVNYISKTKYSISNAVIWPLLYKGWFSLVSCCLVFVVYAEFKYCFVNITDVAKAVECMCTTMIGAVAAIRTLYARYTMTSFKKLLSMFCDRIWIKEKAHPLIFQRCIKRTKPLHYVSLALWGVLILYTILPIAVLVSTEQTMESIDKGLPYSTIFPYDHQQFWNYIFTFILCLWAGITTVSQYYALDALLVFYISYLSGQFEILHGCIARLIPECHMEWLKSKDKNGKASTNLQEMYTKRLHEICSDQSDLMSFCQELDKFMSFPLLINFMSATFQISFLGFQFLIGGTNSFSDFMRFFLFFCSVTAQLYIMCDLGSTLITRSTDTARYLYMCNWEGGRLSPNSPLLFQHDDMELDVLSVQLPLWQSIDYYPANKDFQHKLRFMIMRSHHSVELAAVKYITLSLETLSRILSSSLSYFALLKTFLDKQN